MTDQLPLPVRITGVTRETPAVRTFHFDREISFIPGQFVMVWVPGVDEIPMALSSASSITVQRVGEATSALFSLRDGDTLGIRGPFGNGFPPSQRVLAVAGGVGAAPLLPVVRAGGVKKMLLGARSAADLLFPAIFKESTDLAISTDDGSLGHHGFVADLLKDEDLHQFDYLFCCGPERMMAAILAFLVHSGCPEKGFFSLHRYMKCGLGVCGSCSIDPHGLRVCRDGPVFSGDILVKSEFGHYSRDACGRRRPI
ncbi:MAG: dihydroorotate dehydrogenase electron transfer subunit [Methanolinea sp.]|jgi:dihydroorotate dehydrogenase electron transfer subunit|nr:dihydroorotate dehydrogenase electron transfer subunit [Methanolinea sp.]